MLVEPSSALDISVVDGGVVNADVVDGNDATQPSVARPRIIVMEERVVGLADALERMGFMIRPARTGVEAISLCTESVPLAVVVGPGDGERRRILTGALSVRFPQVPVVHVLAAGDATKSIGDGPRVLSWPLPSTAEVMAVIPHRVDVAVHAPLPSITRVVPPTAAMVARSVSDVPELSADQSETGSIPRKRPSMPRLAMGSPPPEDTMSALRPSAEGPLPPMELPFEDDTLQVAKVALPMTSMSDERSTSPGMRPAANVQDALAPRGEIVDVLRAVAPFLWGLDDCARFLDDLSQHHVKGADVHARTVRLVARLLAQLHARIDELDPPQKLR
jgi:hypothetical protein